LSSTSESTTPVSPGTVGQILAGIGATITLLGAFGIALSAIGITLLLLGTIVSAPYAANPGPYLHDWWSVLGVAALVCLVGIGVWFLAEPAGNVLMLLGAIAALVAVGLALPRALRSS
jgi:hypothetical protein